MEDADRVAAAADAGGDGLGQPSVFGQHLRARLTADDGIEIADHAGIRIRTCDGADDVEGVAHVGHPVAHRLVERVLERLRARFDGHYVSAEQLHAKYILRLALDVFRSHVHNAVQTKQRTDSRRRHPMLSGSGFSDDARLLHPLGQKPLSDRVIDFMGPGMTEVFALQIDLRSTQSLRESLSKVKRGWSTDVVL
mgnify:CR=1 FL=1